jgi:hypothetical protein
MMRLMLFAAIGISAFSFTGFSHGIALPASHSDLAFNLSTSQERRPPRSEERERREERRFCEERHRHGDRRSCEEIKKQRERRERPHF